MTDMDVRSFVAKSQRYLEDQKQFQIVRNFMAPYRNMSLCSEQELLQEKREIGCRKDRRGISIAGTGSLISDSEKKYVIDLMKGNNVPLYLPLYQLYLNDYLQQVQSEYKGQALKKVHNNVVNWPQYY